MQKNQFEKMSPQTTHVDHMDTEVPNQGIENRI